MYSNYKMKKRVINWLLFFYYHILNDGTKNTWGSFYATGFDK